MNGHYKGIHFSYSTLAASFDIPRLLANFQMSEKDLVCLDKSL